MHPRIRRSCPGICALLAFASLTCCASLEPGDVAGKWSANMRELQIVPVFPPREDVRVGDIYFMTSDTAEAVASAEGANRPVDSDGYFAIPVLVGRINFGEALDAQYAAGPMFGDTDPSNLDASGAFALQPMREKAFSAGTTDRGRIVGFPEFMSATYSSGDLSALVPVEALKVSAAAGFTSARSVTVRVPVAESYCLPLSAVLGRLLDQNGNLRNISRNEGSFVPSHVTLLTDASAANVGDTVGYLRVITEVYMARVVDVSILGSGSFGATGSARPIIAPTPAGAPDEPPAPPPDEPAEVVIDRPADTAGPGASPTDLANRLNSQLDAQMAGLSPGVSTRFVSASAHSIGMRTTYERPVAIGYRGVLLRLTKHDDKGKLSVAGMLPINLMTPTGGDDEVPLPSP